MTLGILLTIISFAWWGLAFLAFRKGRKEIVFLGIVYGIMFFVGALTAFFR